MPSPARSHVVNASRPQRLFAKRTYARDCVESFFVGAEEPPGMLYAISLFRLCPVCTNGESQDAI